MSKGRGQRIIIKFTESLTNSEVDLSSNTQAFKVTGKEYKHIQGELLAKEYGIGTVIYREPLASDRLDTEDKFIGQIYNLNIRGNTLSLAIKEDGDEN